MPGFFDRLNDIRIWIRLVASTLTAVIVMWVGFLAWARYEERQIAIDQAHDFANSVHQMTMAGLTGMMITGTIGARSLFLDQIKQSNHVEALKVFRSDAVVGQFGAGYASETPRDPAEFRVLKSGEAHFEVIDRDGEEHLKAIIPAIAARSYLGKNCLNCHAVTEGTVLGAVSMEISLDRANEAVNQFTRSATLVAILFFVPLGIFIWYFIRRLVTRPLAQMTLGLRQIAEGDIEDARELPRTGNDEIGQATQAFNGVMTKAYELIKSQQLSRIVFENAIEGITVTDARSRIQMVNRAFVETTGYSADEVIGQTPSLLRSGKQGDDFYREFWKSLIEKGEWRGEIWNKRKNGTVYPEWLNVSAVKNRRGEVEHFIAIFSDITERKQREEVIAFQAFHDSLTGLPNRILFRDRLEQAVALARRHKYRTPAVMFLDLDRFKQINDTLGHDAGDALLKEVASRLRQCVRESDTVARLGGDEFTILLPETANAEDAKVVAGKVLEMMRRPVTLGEHEVTITTSIGVSMFPKDGRDPDTLMKHADAAMYQVKGRGRADVCFFSEDLVDKPSRRLELETQLIRAIEEQQFIVHYLPIVDLKSGRRVGAEALVRWQSGPGTLVEPEDFLGVAEETGLIAEIGAQILEMACRQAALWRRQGLDLLVTVNLSPRQFHRIEIVRTIESALQRHALPADRLGIEISEQLAMRDVDFTLRTLTALANLGVSIAIDDFGSAYSSISNLGRMPLKALKVDRPFVRNALHQAEDRATIAATISLAQGLGLDVIAEGVETDAQAALLAEMGCGLAQGYHYCPPAAAADIEAFLNSDNRR